MQRVHASFRVNRATAGDERLAGDLATEHSLHRGVRRQPPEQRVLQPLDVEQLQQQVERLVLRRHRESVAAGPVSRCRCYGSGSG